jgi:glutaredoxin
MDIPEPLDNQFTIYSKSGCPNCKNVKLFLQEKNAQFTIIDCDEFILEDKLAFLLFIQKMTGKESTYFPIVFDNKIFVGDFRDTIKHFENILDFDEQF